MPWPNDEDSEDDREACYGDEDYYDPDDRVCKDCNYFKSCGIKVKNAQRRSTTTRTTSYRNSRRTPTTTRTLTTAKAKQTPVVIDESEDTTFTEALMHNASIEAIQAMVDELSNSIKHIPRKSYKNAWKRKKE